MATPDQDRKRRWLRRHLIGIAVALVAVVVVAIAWADTVTPDADIVTLGNQSSLDLGTVAPGASLTPKTSFSLICAGTKHVDEGQTVTFAYTTSGSTVPSGGSLSATSATIGAVPSSWPDDTTGGGSTNCPATPPTLGDNGDSTVTITAPTSPGEHTYVVKWNMTFNPTGSDDPNDITGPAPSVTYTLTVPKLNQTINFAALANKTFGDADFNVSATASSGLAVSFSASGNCTISGNTVHLTGVGSCMIAASQGGNGTYNPAPAVSQSFTIAPADNIAPTAAPTQSPAANGAGWNNSDVTVTWNWTDSGGSGIDNTNCTTSSTSSGQGTIVLNASCKDLAGNTGSASYTVKVDKIAPTASPTQSPAANIAGWNNSDVTVTWNWTDSGGSGIDNTNCTTSSTSSGQGTIVLNASCNDVAGKTGSASYTVKVDTIAPVITGSATTSASGDPYTAGDWTNEDVVVDFSCADTGGSLIKTDTVQDKTVIFEGITDPVTSTGVCTDYAGNSAVAGTFGPVKIDKTAPNRPTASVSPLPNAAGWNNTQPVTVSFTSAGDGGSATDKSGVAGCTADATFTTESATAAGDVASGTCTDNAGNESTATEKTVKIDLTAPTITAAATTSPNAAYWYKANVTVHFTCLDALSDIPAGACPADQTLNTEGAAVASSAQTVTDAAGNTSDASNVVTVKIDKSAPTISGSATAGGDPYTAGTWTNEDVVVSYECTDSLSDVASSDVAGQTVSFEGKTASVSNTGTCTDNADNTAATASFGPIWIDKTAPNRPTASVSPLPNAAGWNNTQPVTVSFTSAGDGGSAIDKSGVAGCTADATFTTESATAAGDVASGTCTDNAGNESTATEKTVKIDLTKPTATWNGGPAAGGTYYFGFVPAIPSCTAVDALSGPKNCAVTGYSNLVGSHTMTATAYDVADNAGTAQRSYTVLRWTLNGFYQPVDMNGVFNTVKNGSTVPLKFEIFAGPTELTDTASVQSLTSYQINCDTSAPQDEVETVATGGTILRYDSTGGQFIYNWKTPSTAGKCYRVTMTTQDGSSLVAFFKLK